MTTKKSIRAGAMVQMTPRRLRGYGAGVLRVNGGRARRPVANSRLHGVCL
jgi:hypothetical protein